MTIRRLHELDIDDARKFLVELVQCTTATGEMGNMSLNALRQTEEHLRIVMHEAACELRKVQAKIGMILLHGERSVTP